MFNSFLSSIPPLFKLIDYRDIINNLDFENMGYLKEKGKFKKFQEKEEKVEA